MNNYFDNAQVRWNLWSPQTIYFKSNNTLKKLIPSENLLSYKSKSDRNDQMAKISGGKLMTTNRYGSGNNQYYSQMNHHAVHVWLKDMKSGYPSACVDFVDMRERKNSVGHNIVTSTAIIPSNQKQTLLRLKKVIEFVMVDKVMRTHLVIQNLMRY